MSPSGQQFFATDLVPDPAWSGLNIECPPSMQSHVRKVLHGEYDVGYVASRPVILDIGANVGSFAAWALSRWPGCYVHCYEPLPENFVLLKRNLGHLEGKCVALNNFAIGDPSRTRLLLGRTNCGEASLYDVGEQTNVALEVVTKSPAILPPAHILKIDTEGSEIDILAGIPALDFDAVLLEYHSDVSRREADAILSDYLLCGGQAYYLHDGRRYFHRGTMKYLHRRLFAR